MSDLRVRFACAIEVTGMAVAFIPGMLAYCLAMPFAWLARLVGGEDYCL